jgi:hypothetical protein
MTLTAVMALAGLSSRGSEQGLPQLPVKGPCSVTSPAGFVRTAYMQATRSSRRRLFAHPSREPTRASNAARARSVNEGGARIVHVIKVENRETIRDQWFDKGLIRLIG